MWKAIETEWNSDIVKEVAQKFTKSIMGERYYNALRKGVDVHSSIPTDEIVSLVKGRNC